MPVTTATARARPNRGAALVLAGVAALVGCGDDGAAPSPAASSATRAAPRTAENQPADELSGNPLPARGQRRLRIDDRKITLHANAASRQPLLEELSRKLSFELVAPDVADEPITLRAEAAPLRDLLPLLLPDRAYRIDYRIDSGSARHEVARLEVGRLGALHVPRQPAAGRRSAASGEASPRRAASRASRPNRPGRDWSALLAQLDDSDAEERVQAIEEIDPEGEGVDRIIERLANDPSALVRAAAARQLEDADTLLAVDALIRALSDPDKQVVLDAIDALEFTDDESVADELTPLTLHPDREIAEAASEAQCFIRWDCD